MPAPGDQHLPNLANGALSNPFIPPSPPRVSSYTAQQIATLQSRLERQLGPEYISTRPGAGGQKVHYLAAEKSIGLANEVFGFNGWSSQIKDIQVDFADESASGKISVGLSVIVRVTLKDGTFHEDIGYGQIENCKSKAMAFEKAKKEGTTDALKRALRNFGNVLGNCIYDKDYLTKVTKVKAVANKKWDPSRLHRHQDYVPKDAPAAAPAPAPAPVAAPQIKHEEPPLPPQKIAEDAEMMDLMGGSFSADFDDFGSGDFEEADFGVMGHADEVVLPAQQPQAARSGPVFDTPSKPERLANAPLPGTRAPPQVQAPERHNSLPQNASRPMTRATASGPVTRQQAGQPLPAAVPPTPLPQDSNRTGPINNNASGRSTPNRQFRPFNMDENEAGAPSPAIPTVIPQTVGFLSARAADKVLQNPMAVAPAFDPNADSPSIRKTAGFDHKRSGPILKGALAGVVPTNGQPGATLLPTKASVPQAALPAPAPAPHGPINNGNSSHMNYNRNFVNPSQESTRRLGAPVQSPGAAHIPRPLSTSGYKIPMKRTSDGPNVNPANVVNGSTNIPSNAAALPGGRRTPILGDITNTSTGASGGAGPTMQVPLPGQEKATANMSPHLSGENGAKRARIDVPLPGAGGAQNNVA